MLRCTTISSLTEPDHSTLDKTLTILRPINCMKYKDFFLSIPQPHSSGQIHKYFCNHKHDINTFASFYTFSNMISCHIKPTFTEYESTVYRSIYIHNLQLWPYFHKSVVTVHTVVFNSKAHKIIRVLINLQISCDYENRVLLIAISREI